MRRLDPSTRTKYVKDSRREIGMVGARDGLCSCANNILEDT